MKRLHLISLLSAFAVLLVASCGTGDAESYVRSDYYTRGIGIYPGSPAEDPSPELIPDDEYRNIALRREAYHSSSYDYNLTAQLVTDGIVTTAEPAYMTFSTHAGVPRLREREWTIDGGPFSKNTLKGEEVYMQYSLHNWVEKADRIAFSGTVAYDNKVANKGYEIAVMGSKDGEQWVELASLKGRGLPGSEGRHVVQTDPNKQTERIAYNTRNINESLSVANVADYSAYRLQFKMEGAVEWSFTAVDFFNAGEQIEMLASKHFGSAWMSASAGEEWIMVDLGSRSSFDKIILNWIHKAKAGKIQTSDDGKQWKDVAALSDGDNLTDEIACKGKARYVRVVMQQAANGTDYMLSEIAVMGRGGLVPQPKAQPAAEGKRYTLTGGAWRVQRASEVSATGETIAVAGYDDKEWIVATVPGTVLTSYKNAGAVPNPNYADNIFHISESFFNSNFWYRNEFTLPEGFKRERLFLNFDGIIYSMTCVGVKVIDCNSVVAVIIGYTTTIVNTLAKYGHVTIGICSDCRYRSSGCAT